MPSAPYQPIPDIAGSADTASHSRSSRIGLFLTIAIVIAILLGTLQQAYELKSAFETAYASTLTYEGPIWIKALKDVLIVIILLACFVASSSHFNLDLTAYWVALVFLVVVLFSASYLSNGPMIALAGIRWSLPIALFLGMRRHAKDINALLIARLLLLLMVICLVLQLYQQRSLPAIYGMLESGYAARTTGFFLIPNTTAFFGCVGAAAVISTTQRLWLKLTAALLALGISLAAQSGTGVVTATLLALFVLTARVKVLLWLLLPFALYLLVMNLSDLTGRENILSESGSERVSRFTSAVATNGLSLDGFGLFTNTAYLLVGDSFTSISDRVVIADSFFASLIGNLGVLLIPILYLCYKMCRTELRRVDSVRSGPIVGVYTLFSFTTIIVEAFPMNILLPVLFWSCMRPEHALVHDPSDMDNR